MLTEIFTRPTRDGSLGRTINRAQSLVDLARALAAPKLSDVGEDARPLLRLDRLHDIVLPTVEVLLDLAHETEFEGVLDARFRHRLLQGMNAERRNRSGRIKTV